MTVGLDSAKWEFCELLAMGMPADSGLLPERLMCHAGLVSEYGALARPISWNRVGSRLSENEVPVWLGPPDAKVEGSTPTASWRHLHYSLPAWPHVHFRFAYEQRQSGERSFDWGFVPSIPKCTESTRGGQDVVVGHWTRDELRDREVRSAVLEAWDRSVFECIVMMDGPYMAHFFFNLLVLWRPATDEDVAEVRHFRPGFTTS